MKRKLVDHLVKSGLAERKDIHRCVLQASMNGGSAVDEITERLDIDDRELAARMADYWGLNSGDPQSLEIEDEVLAMIPGKVARTFGALPIRRTEDGVVVAVYDVDKARPLSEKIRDKTGRAPSLVIAPRNALMEAITERYQLDGDPPSEETADPGGAAVLNSGGQKKNPRRSRPSRTTANTGESPDENKTSTIDAGPTRQVDTARSEPTRQVDFADPEPTRQVDVASDNPFMDLVEKEKSNEGDTSTKNDAPSDEEVETQAFEHPPADLFASTDQQNAPLAAQLSSTADAADTGDQSSVESNAETGGADSEPEDLAGALQQFDAELDKSDDGEASSEKDGYLTTPSTVHWGDYDDTQSVLPEDDSAPGGGSRPDGALAGESSAGSTTEESAIFPVRGESSSVFDFDDDGDEGLTLAEVVDRQRHIIQKLEREIDYQKGLLQTLAELLVEARVISKRKLKESLRAFRKSHREQNE